MIQGGGPGELRQGYYATVWIHVLKLVLGETSGIVSH